MILGTMQITKLSFLADFNRISFFFIQIFREKILSWKSSPPRTQKNVIIEEQVKNSRHKVSVCFVGSLCHYCWQSFDDFL